MSEPVFRRATLTDLAFLVETVYASDRGARAEDSTTYGRLFDLSPPEVKDLLWAILEQPAEGHGLSYESFLVVELKESRAAACAAWIEAADGVSSSFKAAAALVRRVGPRKWKEAAGRIRALAAATPPRSAQALQLESFYVPAEFRGRTLTTALIERALSDWLARGRDFNGIEISLLKGNQAALRAYQRAGFSQARVTNSDDPLFRDVTGDTGFVQLRREIQVTRP